MTIYIKQDGTWTPVTRPYIKKAGAWAPAKTVHVKDAGTWKQAFEWDVTPSDPPEISLEVIQGRYIKVGVRLPSTAHDTDLAKIRVLVGTADKYSGSYEDATYIRTADNTYPNEPWSEFYYNGYKVGTGHDHNDSSVFQYKQYPLNPNDNTDLAGGRNYRFSAWSMDLNGNWSVGTNALIFMPKTGDTNVVVKSARFQPNQFGTWASGVFTPGNGIVQTGPIKRAAWYYGNQIAEAIPDSTALTIGIRSAQVLLHRTADSPGEDVANVYLYKHTDGSPQTNEPSRTEVTKVGTIKKSESKWFTLPTSYHNNFRSGLKGLGLNHQDPAKAVGNADDVLTVSGLSEGVVRQGELYVTWTETPT